MDTPSSSSVLEACGADGPLRLEVVPAGGASEPRCFVQPFAIVGRAPIADLHLDHGQISRRHAYLQVIRGRIFCMDLGSRAGVLWGGRPGRSGWLGGAGIEVGPFRILSGDRPDAVEGEGPDEDELPGVTLEFTGREAGRGPCPFRRTLMVVGRAPGCQVRLSGPDVSKFHCSLLRTPAGVWVVDLLGRGGISVNGARVRYAPLRDGDELQVGRQAIRLRYDAPPRRRRPAMLPSPLAAQPSPSPLRTWIVRPELGRLVGYSSPDQIELVESLLAPLLQELGSLREQVAEMQRTMDEMREAMGDQRRQSLMVMLRMFGAMRREPSGSIREEVDQLRRLAREQRALEANLARRVAPATPAAASGPPSSASPAAEEDIHTWLNQRIAVIRQERQGRWRKLLGSVLGRQGAAASGPAPNEL